MFAMTHMWCMAIDIFPHPNRIHQIIYLSISLMPFLQRTNKLPPRGWPWQKCLHLSLFMHFFLAPSTPSLLPLFLSLQYSPTLLIHFTGSLPLRPPQSIIPSHNVLQNKHHPFLECHTSPTQPPHNPFPCATTIPRL